jgi:hypothetical protein
MEQQEEKGRKEQETRVKTHCGEWPDVGMRGLGADWLGILGSSGVSRVTDS